MSPYEEALMQALKNLARRLSPADFEAVNVRMNAATEANMMATVKKILADYGEPIPGFERPPASRKPRQPMNWARRSCEQRPTCAGPGW